MLGGKKHDVFVKYNHLSKRYIEVMFDPVTNQKYVLRVLVRDGVDLPH